MLKIDRTNTSMNIMPCKILEKTNNRFRIYSASGILNTTFSHTDLIDMRNRDFPKLKKTLTQQIYKRFPLQRQPETILDSNGNQMGAQCATAKVGNVPPTGVLAIKPR